MADDPRSGARYGRLVGVGGIGTGLFFALEGEHDLGRDESRPARLLDVRDYCKLQIVAHYPAVLLGARPSGDPFHVVPVGCVGADEPGRRLRDELVDAGMDVRLVRTVTVLPTLFSVCFQYPDGSGGNITTSDSAAAALRPEDIDAVADLLDRRTIALALPEVPLETRHALLRLAGPRGALRVASLTTTEVGPARACAFLDEVDLLALNAHEAAAVVGRPLPDGPPDAFLEACASALTTARGMRVIVTAGRRGAWGLDEGRWTHTPALDVPVASTAGAGDALLGGTLAALALGVPLTVPGPVRAALAGRPLESALDFGVLLASYSVTSPHTIHPDAGAAALAAFARAHGIALGEALGGTLAGIPKRGAKGGCRGA